MTYLGTRVAGAHVCSTATAFLSRPQACADMQADPTSGTCTWTEHLSNAWLSATVQGKLCRHGPGVCPCTWKLECATAAVLMALDTESNVIPEILPQPSACRALMVRRVESGRSGSWRAWRVMTSQCLIALDRVLTEQPNGHTIAMGAATCTGLAQP
jgi:hypothetical protein